MAYSLHTNTDAHTAVAYTPQLSTFHSSGKTQKQDIVFICRFLDLSDY